MKHGNRLLSLLASLILTFAVVSASPAQATTEVTLDPSFDNGPSYDPRGDATGVGGSYVSDLVVLSLRLPYATDPTFDVNWNTSGLTTGVLWAIDVDGDSNEEYQVILLGGLPGGPQAVVQDADTSFDTCAATWEWDPDGFVFVGFPAACIGDPASFRIQGFIAYSTISGGQSLDWVPGSGAGVFCCALIEGDPAPPPPPADPPVTTAGNHNGYWMLTENGTIYNFGTAQNLGSEVASTVKRTHVEPTPSGNGYWILAESGAVHNKGDAQWFGSALNALANGETAVSLSTTPSGKGYWIFTNRGRAFPYGDAQHFGDMTGTRLNGSVLGSVATSTGKGYWMVASDGGIFSFGDAKFHGSTGNMKLNKPVMAMAPAKDGSGYWLVASDGGIFAFDVPFHGSMGSTPLNKPVSGMVPGDNGYMMVAQDGGIFSFGSVSFQGSLGANPPSSPVISVALQP